MSINYVAYLRETLPFTLKLKSRSPCIILSEGKGGKGGREEGK